MKITINLNQNDKYLIGRFLSFVKENGISFQGDEEYNMAMLRLVESNDELISRIPPEDLEKCKNMIHEREENIKAISLLIAKKIKKQKNKIEKLLDNTSLEWNMKYIDTSELKAIQIKSKVLSEEELTALMNGQKENLKTDIHTNHYRMVTRIHMESCVIGIIPKWDKVMASLVDILQ